MKLSARGLFWALLISLWLHLLFLLGSRDLWPDGSEHDSEVRIDATLLPPEPPPVAPPPKPKPRPKPKPKPVVAVPAATPVLTSTTASPLQTQTPAATGPAVAVADNTPPPVAVPAPVSPARTLPGSGRIRFSVNYGGGEGVGEAIHEWTVEGDHYTLVSKMRLVGLAGLFYRSTFSQSSKGLIDANGLKPLDFQEVRKAKQSQAHFDWDKGLLQLGTGEQLPLAAGAQDILSLCYQLAVSPLDAPQLAVMVTTGRKFERYAMKVEASVPLTIHGQDMLTYHVSYRGRESEAFEAWLAQDMAYLPVKVRYVDRSGEVIELVSEEVNYAGMH